MLLLALAALMWTGVARAERVAGLSTGQCRGDVVELRLHGEAESFDIPVSHRQLSTVRFNDSIRAVETAERPDFAIERRGDSVLVTALETAARGAMATAYVTTEADAEISLRFRVTDTPDAAVSMAVVTRAPAEELDPDRQVRVKMADLLLSKYPIYTSGEREPGTATEASAPAGPAGVRIVATERLQSAGWLYAIKAEIETGDAAYPVERLRVLDESKARDHADVVRFPEAFMAEDGELLATIPARTRVSGIVLLEDGVRLNAPLSLEISSLQGLRTVAAQVTSWDIVPATAKFEPEVSIHVQALVGALWLGDGIGLEDLDATSVRGLGARVAYELSERLGVEADVIGASTGDARFDGVTYDGTQGDLVRSAALGRVQFGGVLRLGEKIIPTLRLGLGVQGASHSAAFTPAGGGAMQEPDVGFEFDFLWYFGAGVDVRLGSSMSAGVGISGSKLVDLAGAAGSSGSLEAGVHLGYAWKP